MLKECMVSHTKNLSLTVTGHNENCKLSNVTHINLNKSSLQNYKLYKL